VVEWVENCISMR